MSNDLDFYQMPRKDLRKYVLSNRDDDEALRIYMDRMRTEPGITRFTLTSSEEDMKKLEEYLKSKLDEEKQSKPDTYQTKYDQRGSNIGGFVDTAHSGSNPEFHQHNYVSQNLTEAAAEIQQLLEQLSQTYPTKTTSEKMVVAAKAVEQIEHNPALTKRLFNAVKAGSVSALEQLLNHPAASFVISALQDWQQSNDKS